MKTNVIKNALTVVGAAYLLNCGSTVIVELAENGTTSTSTGAQTTGTGMPGVGGMGGTSVAWAQNVAFNYVTATCPESGIYGIGTDQFEPSLWPLVSGWTDAFGPDPIPPAFLAVAPNATAGVQEFPSMHRFDTGEMVFLCGATGSPFTVALPVYVE